MRRREEGLGFWLGRDTHKKCDDRVGLLAMIGSWLRPPLFAPVVDLSTAIEAILRTEPLIPEASVVDGCAFPYSGRCVSEFPKSDFNQHVPDGIPCVNAISLLTDAGMSTRNGELIFELSVRSWPLLKGSSYPRIRSTTLLNERAARVDASAWFLSAKAAVRVATPRFIRFPHSRRSVNVQDLGLQESEKLVHEAETVRGMAPGRGELLAVFPNVPIEIISRMRFMPESRQLLYTLMPKPDLSRTRVHEVIAVRDRQTGETHLVPHRTRYRMAFFS